MISPHFSPLTALRNFLGLHHRRSVLSLSSDIRRGHVTRLGQWRLRRDECVPRSHLCVKNLPSILLVIPVLLHLPRWVLPTNPHPRINTQRTTNRGAKPCGTSSLASGQTAELCPSKLIPADPQTQENE